MVTLENGIMVTKQTKNISEYNYGDSLLSKYSVAISQKKMPFVRCSSFFAVKRMMNEGKKAGKPLLDFIKRTRMDQHPDYKLRILHKQQNGMLSSLADQRRALVAVKYGASVVFEKMEKT